MFFKNFLRSKVGQLANAEVEDIKVKYCFVSENIQKDLTDPAVHNLEIELLDGQKVNINRERFVVPEVIFNPKLLNIQSVGIVELIKNVIDNCDPDLRKVMKSNIVLSGGNTMFDGFVNRLQKELGYNYSIIADFHRQDSVYLGGQRLVSQEKKLSSIERSISKLEYDEYGPGVAKYFMLGKSE